MNAAPEAPPAPLPPAPLPRSAWANAGPVIMVEMANNATVSITTSFIEHLLL